MIVPFVFHPFNAWCGINTSVMNFYLQFKHLTENLKTKYIQVKVYCMMMYYVMHACQLYTPLQNFKFKHLNGMLSILYYIPFSSFTTLSCCHVLIWKTALKVTGFASNVLLLLYLDKYDNIFFGATIVLFCLLSQVSGLLKKEIS